jgi:putative protease
MNIVARLKYAEEVKTLSQMGVDIFLMDINGLTTNAIYPMNLDQLKIVLNEVKNNKKKGYVFINKMIHEYDIEPLRKWLIELGQLSIDGLVINDFSVYVLAKEVGLEHLVIYQPGTMNTNEFDVTYLENKMKGMTLSKEITFDEITHMIEGHLNIEFSIVGHGYIDMFYSKRKLISLYLEHKHLEGFHVSNNHHFTIEEKTRPGIYFPILEDEMGTHIYRDKKLESFEEIRLIKDRISDFFIERLFLDDQEYYAAIQAYHNDEGEAFLSRYDGYHKGFYYLPTQKVKGEHYEN